jgi:hypothetical protein
VIREARWRAGFSLEFRGVTDSDEGGSQPSSGATPTSSFEAIFESVSRRNKLLQDFVTSYNVSAVQRVSALTSASEKLTAAMTVIAPELRLQSTATKRLIDALEPARLGLNSLTAQMSSEITGRRLLTTQALWQDVSHRVEDSIRVDVLPLASWQALSLETLRTDVLEATNELGGEEKEVLAVAVETVEEAAAQPTDKRDPLVLVLTMFAIIDYVGGAGTTHEGLVAAARIVWYLLALLAKSLGGGYTPLG